MTLRIVRLGEPRVADEGVRIGTVRRPPRGVPASRFAADDWYDVWYPDLSPSQALVMYALAAHSDAEWARFVRRFRAEMGQPGPRRALDLLAALSHAGDFSVGCYCESEARCHRSVLRALLAERGAEIAGAPQPTAPGRRAARSPAEAGRRAAGSRGRSRGRARRRRAAGPRGAASRAPARRRT
jgi:uncharacterized protein YeaO (DUF488 family)